VLFDDEPSKDTDFSGSSYVWNSIVRRYECRSGFARRDSSRTGEPLWTYVDFYLDFPNGGGLKSRVNIRRCFDCRQ
jgi:hypothetical protein